MNDNIRTRATMLASWYAAERIARDGAIIVNHASAAGMLLSVCGGDVHGAIARCAAEQDINPAWWGVVRGYLLEIARRESEENVPRVMAVTR